jgi:hypothetical protein
MALICSTEQMTITSRDRFNSPSALFRAITFHRQCEYRRYFRYCLISLNFLIADHFMSFPKMVPRWVLSLRHSHSVKKLTHRLTKLFSLVALNSLIHFFWPWSSKLTVFHRRKNGSSNPRPKPGSPH